MLGAKLAFILQVWSWGNKKAFFTCIWPPENVMAEL